MDALRDCFYQHTTLTHNEVDTILQYFQERHLAANEYWLEVGKHCTELGFVAEGILRYHYINIKGEETTCYFALPNEFVTSFKAFSTNGLLTENVQAVEPTTLYTIQRNDLLHLYNLFPALQALGRTEAERVAIRMEDRIAMLQILSAEERYQYIAEQKPHLLQYIPIQHLASYMGITRQHLARIRKKK